MEDGSAFKMTGQSLQYLGLCLAGFVVFFFVGPYASHRELGRLEGQIADLRYRTEEQRLLLPVYRQMRKRAGSMKEPPLPLPAAQALPVEQTDGLAALMGEMARGHGLEALKVAPDVSDFGTHGGRLTVRAAFRGELSGFRGMMLDLAALPHVEKVSEIQLRQAGRVRELQLRFRLRTQGESVKKH